MLFSSCSSSCKCTSECTNKPFQQRRIKKMKLVQTEKCGYGIAADEDINPGDFIIEYVGEVIDDKTCGERLRKLKHKVETNFYLCQINWNMVIDSTYKGNKSRYFNHSCNPNTEMQKWFVNLLTIIHLIPFLPINVTLFVSIRIIDGETRIGIFATRYITKGENLTYDYQFVQFGADQDCYCGAVCCRKQLGAKARKTKNIPSDEAVKLKSKVRFKLKYIRKNNLDATGQSRNYLSEGKTCRPNCIGVVFMLARPTNQRCFGIIRQFDEFSKKHLVTYEDGVTETIDMSREVWELITI
ncbi:unnamed protein product [Eruca vesicaria subsp. sativa]|uniref:Histone-lysine N-methyltransferase n=1 Tax=Eruca vesicaria subsp. sativa TaxID=29727 RepID=A0ABC8M4S1_ERUVS|nr:unnamed protein product [Eruca vesicaria subsp. sativa]